MEITDILSLVKAGFTKDEIVQMAAQNPQIPNPEPVPVADPTPPAEPEPAPVDKPVATAVPEAQPAPAPVPAQEAAGPSLSDIMKSIAHLTSAIQANAIATSTIPGGVQSQQTAEDMIAEIIRPSIKERS